MYNVQILNPTFLSTQSTDTNQPILINAHIGTHVTCRHVSMLTYRLGPTFLFEEHLSASVVATMFRLGPSYLGSFQAPILQDSVSFVAWTVMVVTEQYFKLELTEHQNNNSKLCCVYSVVKSIQCRVLCI